MIRQPLCKFSRYFMFISMGVILVMSLAVSANTIGRYVFSSPIPSIIEITTLYFMIGVIFFSIPYIQYKNSNVRVDLVYNKFGDTASIVSRVVYRIPVIGILSWATYLSATEAIKKWNLGADTAGAIAIPTFYSRAIVPVGLALLSIILLSQVIEDIVELSGADIW